VKIEKCEGPVLGPEELMRKNFVGNGKGQQYEAKKYLDKTTSQVGSHH